MSRRLELTGQKFALLTVIGPSEKIHSSGKLFWECICDCGSGIITHVAGSALRAGTTRSCGCRKLGMKGKDSYNYTSGISSSPLQGRYKNMVTRCTNPGSINWKYYGGKNPPVKVFEEWIGATEGFPKFEAYIKEIHPDFEELLEKGYQVDRIDNNGHYEPGNIRLVSPSDNSNNRDCSIYYEMDGEKLTCLQWARRYNIGFASLANRLQRGVELRKALTAPPGTKIRDLL